MNSTKTLFERIIREEYQQVKLNEQTKIKAPAASSTKTIKPKLSGKAEIFKTKIIPLLKKWESADQGTYFELRYKFLEGAVSAPPVDITGQATNPGGKLMNLFTSRTNPASGAQKISPTAGKSKWNTTYAPRLKNSLERSIFFHKTGEITFPGPNKKLDHCAIEKQGNTTKLVLYNEDSDAIVELYYWNIDTYYYPWDKRNNQWGLPVELPKFQCIMFDSNRTSEDTASYDEEGEPNAFTKQEKLQRYINSNWSSYLPIWGDAADLTNAFLYFKDKHYAMGFLSLAGVLPLGHAVGHIARKYLGNFLVKGFAKGITPMPELTGGPGDIDLLMRWLKDNTDKLDPGIVSTLNNNIAAFLLTNRRSLSRADWDEYVTLKLQLENLDDQLKKAASQLNSIRSSVNMRTELPNVSRDASGKVAEKGFEKQYISNLQDYFKITGKQSIPEIEQDLLKIATQLTGIQSPTGWVSNVAGYTSKFLKYIYKGSFFTNQVSKSLQRDLQKHLSNPNIWSNIGAPLLGKQVKNSKSDAFKLWLKQADDNLPGMAELKLAKERLNALKPGKKPTPPNYGKMGADDISRRQLRSDYDRKLAEWERKSNEFENSADVANIKQNINQLTKNLKPDFYKSLQYQLHGEEVVEMLMKTKVGEEYMNKLGNQLLSYMNPFSRGSTNTARIYGLGTETLGNVINFRKHLDYVGAEFVNVSSNAGKAPAPIGFNTTDARFAINYYTMYKTATIKDPKNDGFLMTWLKGILEKYAKDKAKESEALKRVLPTGEAIASDVR